MPEGKIADYLTPREFAVWKLCIIGKIEKEIAAILKISIKTVSVHKDNISKKRKARGLPSLKQLRRQQELI